MIRPLDDRLVIKPIENSEYSQGGIYTGQAKTSFTQEVGRSVQQTVGEVVAIGPGKRDKKGNRRPVEANIGDIVAFSDSCSRKVDIDGDEYLFIREPSIAFFMDTPKTVEHTYEN